MRGRERYEQERERETDRKGEEGEESERLNEEAIERRKRERYG